MGSSSKKEGGEFIMGGCNPDRFVGQMICLPVEKTSSDFTFWQVALDGVAADSASFDIPRGSVALLDTGSTFIGVSASMLKSIATATGAQPYDQDLYIVDCKAKQQISFTLAGYTFVLSGK
ncbi:hypothetical protein HDV00_007165 [Rhizophlyctis rosea]|nr:hypothetical protein HDV00_007165 [Rhizophlyctis rosea]